MYYSSGNYEAFAVPQKPEGIEKKHAYIVACFLIRDARNAWRKYYII